MIFRAAFAVPALLCLAAPAAAKDLCRTWGEPERMGTLDRDMIPEASGLELVPEFPDRLYHNNDSGDGGVIYVTDPDGDDVHAIGIEGFEPRDAEDLSAGPCPVESGARTCLFLADIGDNAERRDSVHIAIAAIPETRAPDSVPPLAIVRAAYPDGAHNAEAASVHPNGDLYVLTKTEDASPSRLYRLAAAQMRAGGEQQFSLVADLPVAAMLDGMASQKATAMDIAPDGARAVVLTYAGALEIAVDFSAPFDPGAWREDEDWRRIPVGLLPQAEAIAYAADGRGVIYDSESARRRSGALIAQACLD